MSERHCVRFTVYGTPIPQGSKRAFYKPGMKFAQVVEANTKTRPWRQEISEKLKAAALPAFEQGAALGIRLDFFFARPKSVTKKKRPFMNTKPDGDKLCRAVWDSMKGVLIGDDSNFVDTRIVKHYNEHGEAPRVEVVVWSLEDVSFPEETLLEFTEAWNGTNTK